MSQSSHTSLVGSIVERKLQSPSVPPTVKISGKTGFPIAQHRSKSVFARAREEQKKEGGSARPPRPPTVTRTAVRSPLVQSDSNAEEESRNARVIAQASEDWRRQMEEDNQRRVENMSAEELEDARRQIFEQFGPDIGELLKQTRAAKEAERARTEHSTGKPVRPSTPRADSKVLKSTFR